ncbi:MAG TPA: hypothetical protein VJ654_19320 [Noviherbaspirillum sp.]|nr:hypothetical protein [Noviherbaspirillum sp.]
MTSKDKDQFDDEFEAFLHGRDDLSRRLQSLPQPEPPAELDAAILAKVEAELARDIANDSANDPAIPGAAAHVLPGFLHRWRAPLAMAASVLFAFAALLRWQTQSEDPAPLVVAQASTPAVEEPLAQQPQAMPPVVQAGAGAGASTPADGKALATKPPKASHTEIKPSPPEAQIASAPDAAGDPAPPIQIAQADTQESIPRAASTAPAPAAAMPPPATDRVPVPAAVLARPSATANTAVNTTASSPNSPNPEKAKAWVALIEELLKADLRQDALAEWEKFRKAYPQYPVPGKLEARIKALQKQPN